MQSYDLNAFVYRIICDRNVMELPTTGMTTFAYTRIYTID